MQVLVFIYSPWSIAKIGLVVSNTKTVFNSAVSSGPAHRTMRSRNMAKLIQKLTATTTIPKMVNKGVTPIYPMSRKDESKSLKSWMRCFMVPFRIMVPKWK